MAYIALYRKWRPKTFTDVVGQKQVSLTLMKAIRENKVAHAYLFSGPRGTGKTSLAKILARAINCVHGPTDTPCNECESCRQILSGDSMDVIEIDAASNRGIDEVRALRENAKFMPVEMRKKIFIIDEAHMLTNEAWNALLKTVEEPPEHVMFIFATTEMDKLPITIVSRCQRYAFRRISVEDMTDHLLHVARESGIQLDPTAAKVIAVQADGGLRDALSMLDQCSGLATGLITSKEVEEMMGLIGKKQIIKLYEAIRRGDGSYVLMDIKRSLAEGKEVMEITAALAEHLRALLIYKVMPEAGELSVYEDFKEDLAQQSQEISVGELDAFINQIKNMETQAKNADNPRIIIEIGLLSLCSRPQLEAIQGIEDKLKALEANQVRSQDEFRTRLAAVEERANNVVPAMPRSISADKANIDVGEIVASIKPNTVKVVPPPMPAIKRQSKQNSFVSEAAYFGEQIADANKYAEWQKEFLNILYQHRQLSLAACYKQGKLIYVDETHAVFVFPTWNLAKLAYEMEKDTAEHLLSKVLGYEIRLQLYDPECQDAMKYDQVAKEFTKRLKEQDKSTAKNIVVDKNDDTMLSPETRKLDEEHLKMLQETDPVLAEMLQGIPDKFEIYYEMDNK